jgi:hypothetical protein
MIPDEMRMAAEISAQFPIIGFATSLSLTIRSIVQGRGYRSNAQISLAIKSLLSCV